MKPPVSIFIITLNEADRIGKTIEAAALLSDDIVVVDCGSTDGTVDIANALGARTIHNDWPGYGAQKNFAQDQCRCDWVLNIDADEVLTGELIEEIRELFNADPKADAYAIRIVDIVPGENAPRPLAYAFDPVRLYRKTCGRFSLSPVHDRVELQPGAIRAQLKGKIHHFSMRGIGEQISKFNRYTDAQVADLEQRGVALPAWRIYLEFPLAFFKAYVLRRHFMAGSYGFLTAMNYAIFRHLRVAKHHEAKRRNPKTGGIPRGVGE